MKEGFTMMFLFYILVILVLFSVLFPRLVLLSQRNIAITTLLDGELWFCKVKRDCDIWKLHPCTEVAVGGKPMLLVNPDRSRNEDIIGMHLQSKKCWKVKWVEQPLV